MKKGLLTVFMFCFVVFFVNAQIFEDSFDTYEDFIIADIGDWVMLDVDGGATWGATGFDFTNEGYTGTAIVFNPASCAPADPEGWETHTGAKMLVFFDAVTASAPNDDWLITPQLSLGTGSGLAFWMKSVTDTYGLERFAVGVSTTGLDPGDFTIISAGDYVEAPVPWTEYTYDLSAYDGQDIYIGIHCVSNDAFAMFLDDFTVTSTPVTTYTVTFTVDDGTDPIDGANIAINGEDLTTAGGGIATIDLQDGEYPYTITATGYETYTGTVIVSGGDESVPVSMIIISIEELAANGISIYPNPSKGVFNINVKKDFNLEVFDITGKVINTQIITGNSTIEINTSGIYFLKFFNENETFTQRVVVQ